MNVYISSSWKNRDRVRALAILLRSHGHTVYDFTDPACRNTPEIPPEKFPDAFDPERHHYPTYIQRREWRAAVECNRAALDVADACVLLLPCGPDSHADWAYAVGRGKRSAVVGHPRAGERTPTHMWAEAFLDADADVVEWLASHSIEWLMTGLGSTPEAIAAALESHGVRGLRESACECPLAVYLRACGYSVAVGDVDLTELPTSVPWTLSAPMVQFLDRFDRGEWPALVEAQQ